MPAPVYIHKKNPRSQSIKIALSNTGDVVVTTPPYMPKFLIDRFVTSNTNWIQIQQRAFELKKGHTSATNTVQLFGKTYTRKDTFSTTLPIGISISGSNLLFNPSSSPHLATAEKIEAEYLRAKERFLKHTASQYIIPRTQQLANTMNTTFGKITLKAQKTRWGSCSSAGNLNFNWRLVHYQPEIIDYVIIHELAHRTHMDHSRSFWNLVARYNPAYKEHQGWLKRNGLAVS